MLMLMLMLMFMFVFVFVNVVVRVVFTIMLVFVLMFVAVLVVMEVFMFVVSFHCFSPEYLLFNNIDLYLMSRQLLIMTIIKLIYDKSLPLVAIINPACFTLLMDFSS